MRDELLTLLIGDKIKTEGNIRPIGSYIYYSDATGVIYQFDTDNENTVKISEGTRFTTSPDDRILAVAGYEESVDEDTYSLLKTVTLSNGQEQIISKGRFIADFTWSSDSQRLYYLLYIDIPEDYDGSGEDLESEMLCELYVYDLATTENKYLGQLNTASIYSGTTQNELIFSSGFQQDWRYVWVTYGLDIK